MKIADGVEMLEITFEKMGEPSTLHPTLIWDEDTVILVDAGLPGQMPLIRAEIEKAGVSFEKLNIIILTHQDLDHIGSVENIRNELANGIKVFSHENEKPFIQGDECPIRVAKKESNLGSLTPEMKVMYEKQKRGYQDSKTQVDATLTDGQQLPFCGGITVIYTPGHMPGHICLYHNKSKTLIGGDSLNHADGKLGMPPPYLNNDNDQAIASLSKLAQYDIEALISYHAGILKGNINAKIAELVRLKSE